MKKTLLSLTASLAGVGLAWILLTTYAPGSWIAAGAPCPRNWGWSPAWMPRSSPLDEVSFELEPDVDAKICYGRPSLAYRTMIGGDSVPFGRLWRTGANEPTTLHLSAPVRFGALDLGPGSYSLYTVPDPALWEVVVNRSTRQWGLESEYTDSVRALEVGRFKVQVEVLDRSVETFTISAVPSFAGAVDLVLEWQTSRLRIPVESVAAER